MENAFGIDQHGAMTSPSPKSEVFRGSLTASPWTRGWFWDRVEVSVHTIVLRPWMRSVVKLERAHIDCIEFERVRLPLWLVTNVRFRRTDGSMAPKIFVPVRTRRFRLALDACGWPTADAPALSPSGLAKRRL